MTIVDGDSLLLQLEEPVVTYAGNGPSKKRNAQTSQATRPRVLDDTDTYGLLTAPSWNVHLWEAGDNWSPAHMGPLEP